VRQAPDPGNEICRTAKSENVDLIVIATHARHHVAHLFVGSTTMSVLKDPPSPVLAIRYGTRKRKSMSRVVVPVHPQQTSHRALELAARVATEIHLVTVCSEEDQARAEQLQQELASTVPSAKTAVVHGKDPNDELLRYTTKVDADAIFLNAAAEPSQRKIDLVRHAPVPVMVV
jgi:nucleotide-binding universal stress UspA family protein